MVKRFPGLVMAAALTVAALLPIKQGQAEPPISGEVKQFQVATQKIEAPAAPFALDGKDITLAEYAGKVVVLNFWATWCAPCIHEMPSLDRLNATLDQDIATVLTVSTDRNSDRVGPFLADTVKTKTLPAATDPQRNLANAFRVRGLPTTYIVGADGMVKGVLQGPAEWDSEEARALVQHYVDAAIQALPASQRASLD